EQAQRREAVVAATRRQAGGGSAERQQRHGEERERDGAERAVHAVDGVGLDRLGPEHEGAARDGQEQRRRDGERGGRQGNGRERLGARARQVPREAREARAAAARGERGGRLDPLGDDAHRAPPAVAGSAVRASTTWPSRRWIVREQRAATPGSCVTTTSAWPCVRVASSSAVMTAADVPESSAPVGSSAKTS